MKKRTLAVFVCALMIALCTAGCGKTADTAAGAESRTLENVQKVRQKFQKRKKRKHKKMSGKICQKQYLPQKIRKPKKRPPTQGF